MSVWARVFCVLAKEAMVAAAAGTGWWVGVGGTGGVSLHVSIHRMNGRMMSSVGHHSLVEPKAKIGDEQLRVYCERTEGGREGRLGVGGDGGGVGGKGGGQWGEESGVLF